MVRIGVCVHPKNITETGGKRKKKNRKKGKKNETKTNIHLLRAQADSRGDKVAVFAGTTSPPMIGPVDGPT